MADEIIVRPASPADARVGSYLAHIAMGRLADFLLGLGRPTKAREVLEKAFARGENRFSYHYADVAETNNQVVGLLLSYPGMIMKRLALRMVWEFLAIYGLPGMFRFLRRAFQLVRVKEAMSDEYFIHIVAVLPGFQGQGIGTRLLSFAEEKAKAQGLRKCSLSVEIGNNLARSLYERLGYEIADTVTIEQLNHRIGCKGFHRMVKLLTTPGSG